MPSKISDDEFIATWKRLKSPQKIANFLDMAVRNVYSRRRTLEGKLSVSLQSNNTVTKHAAKVSVEIEEGVAIVFSDAHFWDTTATTAYRALLKFIKELRPTLLVANGDMFDGASISRHNRIGFLEARPTVIQELDACKDMLYALAKAAKGATLTWPLGNHDARFETFLAGVAPEYEFVNGFHLKDHFPEWMPCWATWVNGHTVIKHRWKSGIHAAHNNTVGSGMNFVTGHLHSMKVSEWTDYNGTRYGVDTGCLARIDGDQFVNYTETNPVNWRSGFVVLTFHKGELLPPEKVQVLDEDAGTVCFRGKVHTL